MNHVYFREGNWVTCSQCDASVNMEHGERPPCGCGSKAGKSASVSTFRRGAGSESELTQSDLDGIAEAAVVMVRNRRPSWRCGRVRLGRHCGSARRTASTESG